MDARKLYFEKSDTQLMNDMLTVLSIDRNSDNLVRDGMVIGMMYADHFVISKNGNDHVVPLLFQYRQVQSAILDERVSIMERYLSGHDALAIIKDANLSLRDRIVAMIVFDRNMQDNGAALHGGTHNGLIANVLSSTSEYGFGEAGIYAVLRDFYGDGKKIEDRAVNGNSHGFRMGLVKLLTDFYSLEEPPRKLAEYGGLM